MKTHKYKRYVVTVGDQHERLEEWNKFFHTHFLADARKKAKDYCNSRIYKITEITNEEDTIISFKAEEIL